MNLESLKDSLEKVVDNGLKKLAEKAEKMDLSSIDQPIAKEVKDIPDSPEGYRRPHLRKEVKEEIYRNAPKDSQGRYLDANTGLPIEGTPDIGHKPGHEYRREAKKAYDEKLTQEEFNDKMNDASLYQLEDPHNNRSHKYEDKS